MGGTPSRWRLGPGSTAVSALLESAGARRRMASVRSSGRIGIEWISFGDAGAVQASLTVRPDHAAALRAPRPLTARLPTAGTDLSPFFD
jgi:hypothetical protein